MNKIPDNNSLFSTEQLFREIHADNPYTKSQEKEYLERIINGDLKARDDFFRYNLLLVAAIARKYIGKGIPREDLIQAGAVGLLEAISKYNPEIGKFNSHAGYWIKKYILKLFYNDDLVYYPQYLKDIFVKIYRVEKESPHKLSDDELAERTNFSKEIISCYNRYRQGIYWIDNEKESYKCVLTYDKEEELVSDIDYSLMLEKMEKVLSERQFKVLCLRYGFYDDDCMNLPEIGRLLDVSDRRIWQIDKKAKDTLKMSKVLEDFRQK